MTDVRAILLMRKLLFFFNKVFALTSKVPLQPLYREIYGETRLHYDGIDVTKGDPRCMSLIIALNDDYEGGEIYFPNQEYKIKLKRGQAIAFPPYWTHPHGVNTPLNGTLRYTINTWLLE